MGDVPSLTEALSAHSLWKILNIYSLLINPHIFQCMSIVHCPKATKGMSHCACSHSLSQRLQIQLQLCLC